MRLRLLVFGLIRRLDVHPSSSGGNFTCFYRAGVSFDAPGLPVGFHEITFLRQNYLTFNDVGYILSVIGGGCQVLLKQNSTIRSWMGFSSCLNGPVEDVGWRAGNRSISHTWFIDYFPYAWYNRFTQFSLRDSKPPESTMALTAGALKQWQPIFAEMISELSNN